MHPGQASGSTGTTGAVDIPISHEKVGIIWRISQIAIDYAVVLVSGLAVPNGVFSVQLLVNGIPFTSKTFIQSGVAAQGDPPCDIGRGDVLTVRLADGINLNTNVVVGYYYDEILESVGN